MNKIEVIAFGAPGSLARRIQEDPNLALECLREVAKLKGLTVSGTVNYLDASPEIKAVFRDGAATAFSQAAEIAEDFLSQKEAEP